MELREAGELRLEASIGERRNQAGHDRRQIAILADLRTLFMRHRPLPERPLLDRGAGELDHGKVARIGADAIEGADDCFLRPFERLQESAAARMASRSSAVGWVRAVLM